MNQATLSSYRAVWLVDFEFIARPGELASPVCMVARELHSNRLVRIWLHDEDAIGCPINVGPECLFVSYYAAAELLCMQLLGWPEPVNVLDLYAEFRNHTNHATNRFPAGLVDALAHCGQPHISSLEKEETRQLIMSGGPFTEHEKEAILDYCQEDVDSLRRLLPWLLSRNEQPRALLRGRYIKAVAQMERRGVPIDLSLLSRLKKHWNQIRRSLIHKVDPEGLVYQGCTFKLGRWEAFLKSKDITWPRTPTGRAKLDDETFKMMAQCYPEVLSSWCELRQVFSKLRVSKLAVGLDARNRVMLSPFRSKTGRNQPSTSKFIFGQPRWLRGLIKPFEGQAVAYVDYCQQEFGIAAALSKDSGMLDAYRTGDPYLAFAIQAGLAPRGATKLSHKNEREMAKACVLAVQYGTASPIRRHDGDRSQRTAFET